MPRPPLRVLASGLLMAAAALAAAQPAGLRGLTKMEGKPPAAADKLAQLRNGTLRTAGPDLKANQDLLRAVAKYHVYKVTDERYYLQPETGDLKPRDTQSTFDQVLLDITNQMLQPGPDTKFSTAQQEYIGEFGAGLNDAIRDVLRTNPPAAVRVNAGRLLALAARSGAPALAPTIHELLTNTFPLAKGGPAKTPPELLLYAVRAAGNLFAAYDPVWHLNNQWRTQFQHSFPEKDQVTLAGDLLALLDKGPGVADLAANEELDRQLVRAVNPDGTPAGEVPSGDKAAPAPAAPRPEAARVTAFYRRAVAAAVCKIRPDLLGEVGKPPLRPGVAVARLAVGDVALAPAVTTPEVAEALLGLCYLAPSQDLNVAEVLAAAAAAGRTLAQNYTTRRSNPEVARHAQLVAWKLYAERLNAALDHLARQVAQNPRWKAQQAAAGQLVGILRDDLVVPLRRDDPTVPASSERLTEFLRGRAGVPPAERGLYPNDPTSVLTPRPAGS